MAILTSSNPYRPGDVVIEAQQTSAAAVPDLVERAHSAQLEWAAQSELARAATLQAAAGSLETARDRVVDLIVREVGKPVVEARGEVQRGIDILRYHASSVLMPFGDVLAGSTATGLQFTRRRPLGTVAIVTPWNFPVAIPLWKLVPALAWGNAVVLKPSSAALGVAMAVAETLTPHLPAGLLQLAPGESELVRALVGNPGVDGLSFTGSTAVGTSLIRQSAERARPIPCQAEMGGSNPTVVLADADLDKAVAGVATAVVAFAGQKCTATSRIIVERAIYDEFRDRLTAHMSGLAVGDPAVEATIAGPVIDLRARRAALDAVAASSGTVLVGGSALDQGSSMEATLVEITEADDILLRDEVFAPVAALTVADDAADALRQAGDTEFGLSAGLYTTDLVRALEFIDGVDAGMLRINAPTTGVDYWAPFGGLKASSFGVREQGLAARDFYTHGVTVFLDR